MDNWLIFQYSQLLRWGDEVVKVLRPDGWSVKGVGIWTVGKSADHAEPDSTTNLRVSGLNLIILPTGPDGLGII